MEHTKLQRAFFAKELDGLEEALERMNISYEKNRYLNDVLKVDIFIPNQ